MNKTVKLTGATIIATVVITVLSIVPAWAHRPQVTGVSACSAGNHQITWTIGNNLQKQPMTIMSADAMLGSTPYAVTGYSTDPIIYGTPTAATTSVPGDLTGEVDIVVVGRWPDGITNPAKGSVMLTDPCPATTTTTTTPASTTTTTPTVTTMPGETPSTFVVPPPGSDVNTCTPGTTAAGPTTTGTACQLAMTGGPNMALVGGGAAALLVLGALALGFGITPPASKRRGL